MAKTAKKPIRDLFDGATMHRQPVTKVANGRSGNGAGDYTAHDIEVLEGLEPVRRRPNFVGANEFNDLLGDGMDLVFERHGNLRGNKRGPRRVPPLETRARAASPG